MYGGQSSEGFLVKTRKTLKPLFEHKLLLLARKSFMASLLLQLPTYLTKDIHKYSSGGGGGGDDVLCC